MRSHTVSQNFNTPSRSWDLAAQILTHSAYSVSEKDTDKLLNDVKLINHPKYRETWNKVFSNEMGRLYQGVGKGKNGLVKRVEGINNFYLIHFEDLSKDRLNKICYTSVVCEVRPGKKDPDCTIVTICGTNVYYPEDVGTNTTSL